MTELADVARRFARVGDRRAIQRDLEATLLRSARPLAGDVRTAIGRIEARGARSTGLRRRLADAVTVRSWTSGDVVGASVFVDGSKMPTGQGALPAYMEGVKPRWRHPVYGNRDAWVTQQARPYFYRTVQRQAREEYQARVRDFMSQLAADVAKRRGEG